MGILEDISRFLETRLEEYIRNNPQLELQALDDQLRQQEMEVLQLLVEYRNREKLVQEKIFDLAEQIKVWHGRAQKAASAGRQDLADGAHEREAALLKEGNIVWAQMELIKKRIAQTAELQGQIQSRRQEVRVKIEQAAKTQKQPEPQPTFRWENLNPPPSRNSDDPLEQQFQKWETDEELERLKRKMGR